MEFISIAPQGQTHSQRPSESHEQPFRIGMAVHQILRMPLHGHRELAVYPLQPFWVALPGPRRDTQSCANSVDDLMVAGVDSVESRAYGFSQPGARFDRDHLGFGHALPAMAFDLL